MESLGLLPNWSCSDHTHMRGSKLGVLSHRVSLDLDDKIIDLASVWNAGNESRETWDFLNDITEEAIPNFGIKGNVDVTDMVSAAHSSFVEKFPDATHILDSFHRLQALDKETKAAYRRLSRISRPIVFTNELNKSVPLFSGHSFRSLFHSNVRLDPEVRTKLAKVPLIRQFPLISSAPGPPRNSSNAAESLNSMNRKTLRTTNVGGMLLAFVR